MRTILAIDLGNEFGYAVKQSATIDSGWHRLTNKPALDPGKKFKLFDYWMNYEAVEGIDAVYYEDVKRHVSLYNARAYCGFLAILQSWCYKKEIKCVGVGVGTIKKFWVGNGRATKEMMIAEANKRGFETDNDNEADAIALLHYALELDK